MSEFTSCSRGQKMSELGGIGPSLEYTYNRDGREHSIHSGMLISLFKTHGYCVDPGMRNTSLLSNDSINQLKSLAIENNDINLTTTITNLSNNKAPSPRMANDTIMHETTLNERHRFDHLTGDNRSQTINILRTILHIGLYLAGWKGPEEPYITNPRIVRDFIRAELKISPLIQSLHTDRHYPLVKNFPIVNYCMGSLLKANIMDVALTVDQCLNRITCGIGDDHQTMAGYLISTAYYYITVVCNTPLPMLDPLIRSLANKIQ